MIKLKMLLATGTLFLLGYTSFCQAGPSISKFSGLWINTEVEHYKIKNPDERMLYSISPQFLSIDSSGLCTVLIQFEQKTTIGRPVKVRRFGKLQQLTYKRRGEIYLTEIKDHPDLICYTCSNCICSIIFKRK